MSSFQTQQVLVPQEVFVGDTAQLRVSFSSAQRLRLRKFSALDSADAADDFSLQSVELLENGEFHELVITFVPWRSGLIQLPAQRVYQDGASADFGIDITPSSVEVASILGKTGQTELQPQLGPQLVPGTTWILYLMAAGGIALVAAVCVCLAKFSALTGRYRNFLRSWQLKKNAAKAGKGLRCLARSASCTDKEFSSALQNIIRAYFEGRYGERFSSCASPEFLPKYYAITQNLLPDSINERVEAVHAVLRRTDFVRYSPDAHLERNERPALIDTVRRCIAAAEKGADDAAH